MLDFLQPIFPFLVTVMWTGGTVLLFFRFRAKQKEYLRRFPPVEGMPLDAVMGGNPFGAANRALYRAMFQRQSDVDTEQQRHEVLRQYRVMAYWVLGFPLATSAVVALVIVTGLVHPQ